MILEQGRIIEFDRYASFLLMRKLTLLCAQACHLVKKLNFQILFVVQGNGKRRICNVEKNGRSLDSSHVPALEYQFFSHVVNAINPPWEDRNSGYCPAEVLCETAWRILISNDLRAASSFPIQHCHYVAFDESR